jgi:hypothetical protein
MREEDETEEEYGDDLLIDCDPFDAPEAPSPWTADDFNSLRH